MAGVRHAFTNPKADGGDATITRPSDWNGDHVVNDINVLGEVRFSGDISPAQLVANTDNWAPTGLAGAAVIRFTTDATRQLTGITGGADGRVLTLFNVGAFPLVLKHDVTSTAANRFSLPNSADDVIFPGASTTFWYDITSSRWRPKSAQVNPIVFALTADHAISATAATEVTGLGPCTLQPGTYKYAFSLIAQSATTTVGIGLGVNFTGTAAVRTILLTYPSTGGTAVTGIFDDVGVGTGGLMEHNVQTAFTTTAPNMVNTAGFVTVNANVHATIEGILVVTVAGALQLWHSSETATSTTVKAGSVLIVTRCG